MTKTKLSIVAALVAAAAVPAIASADHDRRSDNRTPIRHETGYGQGYAGGWTSLGEVGTHANDAEDYVPVNTRQRMTQIELTAQGRAVRLDDVRFQLEDGRIVVSDVNRTLRDGERIVLDVPAHSPLKMLVLDYANRGPFFRGHEDSRIAVRGLVASDRNDRGYDGGFDRQPDVSVRDRRTTTGGRFVIRGGVRVRI
jgi:hypothetical protein